MPRKHNRTGNPKGHWPAGKPRNPQPPAGVIAALKRSVRRRGIRPTARQIGCDDRTVRRWLNGRHVAPQFVAPILALE